MKITLKWYTNHTFKMLTSAFINRGQMGSSSNIILTKKLVLMEKSAFFFNLLKHYRLDWTRTFHFDCYTIGA